MIVSLGMAAFPVDPVLAADTGWVSPSNIQSTQWVNSTAAYFSDDVWASEASDDDNVVFNTFSITIPSGNVINGIEVRVEGYTTATRDIDVDLSWVNTGNNWTTAQFLDFTNNSSSDEVLIAGGPNDTWGRSWSISEVGVLRVRLTTDNDSGTFYLDHVQVKVYYDLPPEIEVQGNGTTITDGDTSPSTSDFTDFGSVPQNIPVERLFTIHNTGTGPLHLGTITFTGGDAGDFSIIAPPAPTVNPGESTTFTIRLTASGSGNSVRDTTFSIVNNDANENPYNFDIQGTRVTAEINVQGNGTSISDGDSTPSTTDCTNFGSVIVGSSQDCIYTIFNNGPNTSNILHLGPVNIGGTNAGDFLVLSPPSSPITNGSTTTFTVRFTPSTTGAQNANISFINNDTNESPYNWNISGIGLANTPPTVTSPIPDVNVLEDAPNIVFSLYPYFEDVQDVDNQLTYTIQSNTNSGLFSSVSIVDSTNFALDFAPDANGTADITIRATDTGGLFVEDTFNVYVTAVNDEPDFTAVDSPAVLEDAEAQAILNWVTSVDFGPPDEDSSQAVSAYLISNSTCTTLLSAGPFVSTAGTLTYTPAPNQNGSCTFDIQIQDNGGTSNGGDGTGPIHNFTITVTAVDDASTTTDDTATISEDDPATPIDVRGNDNDIDSAVELIQSVTQPTNGTVAITNSGVDLTYEPNSNYCNDGSPTDDFTYTLTGGATGTVEVTVTCMDDTSTTTDDAALVWEDSSANTIDVRGNDNDIDSAVELIQSVTQPANGTVVITNNGADLTYEPDPNYCNDGSPTDDFTYTLTGGATSTVEVTVTCQTAVTPNITADDKTYDGTPTATFTCALTPDGGIDDVACSGGSASFDDKNAGIGKTVIATGIGLSGADAFKYELTVTTASDTSDIEPRDLTVNATGINKPYDGNVNATVNLSDDRLVTDNLTTTYISASFADPNVGTNIPVSVSGISISGGSDAANYNLLNTTASTVADITIAGQTINITQSAPASAANGTSFDVAATASSGLPVTITTSGSCSGGDTDGDATITMTSGTGTCSLFYNQAGNTNYSPAPEVQEDVNATESPVFTSADSTTFDLGFAGLFNIAATGNPQTMTISISGTLPSGVLFTDNGDGTATINGTPAAGTAGVYGLILTADNGVTPNGVQNFTLIIRNGPIVGPNGVNSVPETRNGSISENEIISTALGITQLTIEFSQDVYDPAGDTDSDDVTNPANYLLVRSVTGTFATTSCVLSATDPDTAISVDSVTYSNGGGSGPFIATLNINGGLPLNVEGFYRFFVCGTTSVVDAVNTGLILAGDGVNPGTDFIRIFRISASTSGGGGGGGGGNNKVTSTISLGGVLIPVTGFVPNQITKLPTQTEKYVASKLTLDIPSINVNLPIVGLDFKNNSWDVTWLGGNAGYLEGSAYPTWTGNTVLTGHVTDPNGKPGPFAYINELKYGEKIYIHNNGFTYVYEVRQSSLLLPSSIKSLFKHEDDAWLSLVTCENFNTKTNSFSNRRLVRAVLISTIPTK